MKKLEYITKGTYGIIMKETINEYSYIIKQQNYDNNLEHEFGLEFKIGKLTYSENPDIFIKLIKLEIADFNRATSLNQSNTLAEQSISNNIPDIGWYQYIFMEYMELGDLYNLNKNRENGDEMLNIVNVLGCYFNGLYILHNKLNIIHGDMTSLNILVRYIGPGYKQKIIYKDKEYFLISDGYMFKITDFGISEYIKKMPVKNDIIECHIYRDYLLLYYIYFQQKNNCAFLYYNLFSELIKNTIYKVNSIALEYSYDLDIYDYYFDKKYNYFSVCKYFNKFHCIDKDNILFYKVPEELLDKFLELYNIYFEIDKI